MKESEYVLKSLRGHNSFGIVLKYGNKIGSKDYFASIIYKENSDNKEIIYGISISKRIAKKAVVRNRIKRLIRESLRQILIYQPNLLIQIEKIVIIWKTAPLKPKLIKLSDVKPQIEELLHKAALKAKSTQ